jgi:hypothetical protein
MSTITHTPKPRDEIVESAELDEAYEAFHNAPEDVERLRAILLKGRDKDLVLTFDDDIQELVERFLIECADRGYIAISVGDGDDFNFGPTQEGEDALAFFITGSHGVDRWGINETKKE